MNGPQFMPDPEILPAPTTLPAPPRLIALDAFRGAVIALMVLVNDPGDGAHVYSPLQHADWNGWTPTDVVFPSFLWIVGVAITLALGRRLAAGVARSTLFKQVVRRSLILYLLGCAIYIYPHFDPSTQRLMGVLQRIAICYLIASAIYLTTGIRGQIIWIVSLLASYWLMMKLIPVPGFGAGHLDVEGNLAHYIDRIVLGHHNYAATKTWDPEGFVDRHHPLWDSGRRHTAYAPNHRRAQHLALLCRQSAAGRRVDLQQLAADQQEALDQFLLALHGRPRFRDVGDVPVDHRWHGLEAFL
jgi:hypothetical protein